jgi:hypothetical protein
LDLCRPRGRLSGKLESSTRIGGGMRNCDPVEQQARQDFLDELYRAAGRDRLEHPDYSLYTGLYQQWTQQQTEVVQ